MPYIPQTWADLPLTTSPLSAARLNNIEAGIASIGTWTSYTPSWTNISTSGATNFGRYAEFGKLVFVNAALTTGTATPVSGSITLSLPVTARTTGLNPGMDTWGNVHFRDVSTGTGYTGVVVYATSTTVTLRALNASGTYLANQTTTNGIPFAWDTGDIVTASFSYEAA